MKTLLLISIYILYPFTVHCTGLTHITISCASQNSENKNKAIDSVELSVFKIYISNLLLLQDDSIVYDGTQKFYLIDFKKYPYSDLALARTVSETFNKIKFTVGIDSSTSVLGAIEGELDPMHGMYWTWHSGYIFIKLEGTILQNNQQKKAFTLHIGGYEGLYKAIQHCEFHFKQGQQLEIDIKAFINQLFTQETFRIMSPSIEAVALSNLFTKCINIK